MLLSEWASSTGGGQAHIAFRPTVTKIRGSLPLFGTGGLPVKSGRSAVGGRSRSCQEASLAHREPILGQSMEGGSPTRSGGGGGLSDGDGDGDSSDDWSP
jgi:hypothetical protein